MIRFNSPWLVHGGGVSARNVDHEPPDTEEAMIDLQQVQQEYIQRRQKLAVLRQRWLLNMQAHQQFMRQLGTGREQERQEWAEQSALRDRCDW